MINGEAIVDTCDAMMEEFGVEYYSYGDYSDYDYYYDDDYECGQQNESGDCLEMLAEYNIDGLEYCWYNETYDWCDDSSHFCNATVLIHGEWHNSTCDDLEEHFGIYDGDMYEDWDSECAQWEGPFDCMEEEEVAGVEGLDHCMFEEAYDCEMNYMCRAEIMMYGETW
jgi:hypothetical protein